MYNFDIETGDFAIKGIELVAHSRTLYVSSHYLEKLTEAAAGNSGSADVIEDVRYLISVGETNILSVSQADNPFALPDSWVTNTTEGLYMSHTSHSQNLRVRPNDTLHIQVLYKINGKEQKRVGKVKLGEIVKPSEFNTGDKWNVIDLK